MITLGKTYQTKHHGICLAIARAKNTSDVAIIDRAGNVYWVDSKGFIELYDVTLSMQQVESAKNFYTQNKSFANIEVYKPK